MAMWFTMEVVMEKEGIILIMSKLIIDGTNVMIKKSLLLNNPINISIRILIYSSTKNKKSIDYGDFLNFDLSFILYIYINFLFLQ
jgi:hypothetical protein